VTIGQASLPVLSKEASRKKMSKYKETLFSSFLQAIFLALPTAAIFLILRIPLVRLAYGAKEFPWKATLVTGQVIAFLVPLVVSGTINDILGRGFYAFQDTKTPLVVSWVSLVVFIIIAIGGSIFSQAGVIVLALATSISSVVQSLILMILLFKKIEIKRLDRITVPLFKMIISSVVSIICVWLLLRGLDLYVFDTTRISGLIGLTSISSLGGIIVYLSLGLAFQLQEARAIVKLAKSVLVWPRDILPIHELPPQVD
jgi:putative peptidoglycan lipid II flippase